jgi:hypothetical protein
MYKRDVLTNAKREQLYHKILSIQQGTVIAYLVSIHKFGMAIRIRRNVRKIE